MEATTSRRNELKRLQLPPNLERGRGSNDRRDGATLPPPPREKEDESPLRWIGTKYIEYVLGEGRVTCLLSMESDVEGSILEGREEMDIKPDIDEQLREMLKDVTDAFLGSIKAAEPTHFYRDGSPILDDEIAPAFLRWAMLFEDIKYKTVELTITLYGERLSTVWLGLDHSFMPHIPHRPLIFETMLFKPTSLSKQKAELDALYGRPESDEDKAAREKQNADDRRRFPHDQLQLRYATEREAQDMHDELKLQCLIPPRWRSFLLGTIGDIPHWKKYDDEDEED